MFGLLTAQRHRRFIPYFLLDDGPPTPPDLPPEPPTNTPMTPPNMPPLTPMSPVPPDSSPPAPNRRHFLIGIGLGLIPLIIAMVGLGATINPGAPLSSPSPISFLSFLLAVGAILYFIELVVMIVFLTMERLRRVGFGLLTMVLITPVVFFIGCLAMFSAPRP